MWEVYTSTFTHKPHTQTFHSYMYSHRGTVVYDVYKVVVSLPEVTKNNSHTCSKFSNLSSSIIIMVPHPLQMSYTCVYICTVHVLAV